MYLKNMTLYFPRNAEEERTALSDLPADIGNEMGEPVVEDRKIRIESGKISSECVCMGVGVFVCMCVFMCVCVHVCLCVVCVLGWFYDFICSDFFRLVILI